MGSVPEKSNRFRQVLLPQNPHPFHPCFLPRNAPILPQSTCPTSATMLPAAILSGWMIAGSVEDMAVWAGSARALGGNVPFVPHNWQQQVARWALDRTGPLVLTN